MSSSGSSSLRFELKPAWLALGTLGAGLALICISLWQCEAPVSYRVLALVGFSLTVGWQLTGQWYRRWPGALTQAVLGPDGTWELIDVRGVRYHAVLAQQSRIACNCALLVWHSPSRRHWALLIAKGVEARIALRRLRVRLRFS